MTGIGELSPPESLLSPLSDFLPWSSPRVPLFLINFFYVLNPTGISSAQVEKWPRAVVPSFAEGT